MEAGRGRMRRTRTRASWTGTGGGGRARRRARGRPAATTCAGRRRRFLCGCGWSARVVQGRREARGRDLCERGRGIEGGAVGDRESWRGRARCRWSELEPCWSVLCGCAGGRRRALGRDGRWKWGRELMRARRVEGTGRGAVVAEAVLRRDLPSSGSSCWPSAGSWWS